MTSFEVTFTSANPELARQLALINDMPEGQDRTAIVGELMVYLGMLWIRQAERQKMYGEGYIRRRKAKADAPTR